MANRSSDPPKVPPANTPGMCQLGPAMERPDSLSLSLSLAASGTAKSCCMVVQSQLRRGGGGELPKGGRVTRGRGARIPSGYLHSKHMLLHQLRTAGARQQQKEDERERESQVGRQTVQEKEGFLACDNGSLFLSISWPRDDPCIGCGPPRVFSAMGEPKSSSFSSVSVRCREAWCSYFMPKSFSLFKQRGPRIWERQGWDGSGGSGDAAATAAHAVSKLIPVSIPRASRQVPVSLSACHCLSSILH